MSPLDLRLSLDAEVMRIRVGGDLDAANAHLLSKVVIDCLRRYALPALELDLSQVLAVDEVGLLAIRDCERCAHRHGVLFSVVGARDLRLRCPPLRRLQTGTICLPHS
jgi:hypothetical protein